MWEALTVIRENVEVWLFRLGILLQCGMERHDAFAESDAVLAVDIMLQRLCFWELLIDGMAEGLEVVTVTDLVDGILLDEFFFGHDGCFLSVLIAASACSASVLGLDLACRFMDELGNIVWREMKIVLELLKELLDVFLDDCSGGSLPLAPGWWFLGGRVDHGLEIFKARHLLARVGNGENLLIEVEVVLCDLPFLDELLRNGLGDLGPFA